MGTGLYILYLVLVFVATIGGIFIIVKIRSQGKIIAFFVDKDKGLVYKMFKKRGNWFKFAEAPDEEIYFIDTDSVMIVEYPFALPGFLRSPVKCLIYARNNPWPLTPSEVSILPKSLTAKEIASAMDEHVIDDIVRATEGKSGKRFPEWLLPGITILILAVLAVMIFMNKMDIASVKNGIIEIQQYIEAVK